MIAVLFLTGYIVIGGAATFGLLYWVYRRKINKGTLSTKSTYARIPPIVGLVNFILPSSFMTLYVLAPALFSPDQTISSPIMYVLFTLFSVYFYVLAMPLSMGCIGLATILYQKQYLSKSKFIFSTSSNGIGTVLLAALIYNVFG